MNKILFSLLLSCLGTAAFAQVAFKVGGNLSTIAEKNENFSYDDVENNSVLGAVVGLSVDLGISDIFTIQPELLFSQNGGRNTFNALGTKTEVQYRFNYIEIPVLAKIKLGNKDNEGLGIYLAAGPWVGLALNGSFESTTTVGNVVLLETKRDFTFDEEDDTRRLNYGLSAAAGISYNRLSVDLRYNHGINNLIDNDADNNNDNSPVRQTRGIALTLAYAL